MPAASWMGLRATMSCIVEQFGLAMMPLWASSASGLTSETTSGTPGSRRKAEGLSTTTHPRGGERGPPRAGGRRARREDRDVEALDRLLAERLDDEAALELAAGRALGGQGGDSARREVALAQLLEQDRPHGARGAHDGDAEAHGLNGCSGRTSSAPSSKVWCRARTAGGTRSARPTQEILIGEVEIISMLISSLPRVANTFAATPGCDFIPAPTTETFPIVASSATRK